MRNITFENINHLGQVIMENDLYIHVHNPEMLLMYDSNFIKYKKSPSLAEFKEAANYLGAYHLKFGQKHVKFYFPENEKLNEDLMDYFMHSYYGFSFLELYAIQPNQFPAVNDNPEIEIRPISNKSLAVYLKLQYDEDIELGIEFAKQKQGQYMRNFQNDKILQLIAYYNGNPVGSVDVINSSDTAEIDSLTVHESFRNKGIGARLQKFVMNQFFDKTIILVADGEDTPREMYRKQNYQNLGFRYEVLKIY